MKRLLPIALIALLPALSACVGPPSARSGTGTNPATVLPNRPMTPPPTQPAPSRDGFIAPRIMQMAGLQGVIGQNAQGLIQQFGTPTLDVREGDVRKLQYRGAACVLDIYLYPLQQGVEPSATHVDARRSSDGLDVDRASCVAASRR